MRPGSPWSVKGIDGEARQAAKRAARQAGMTLGQWLNTVIKETTNDDEPDHATTLPHPARRTAQQSREFTSVRESIQPRSASTSATADMDISRRLDSLAGQLSMLSETRPAAPRSRYREPARDEPIRDRRDGHLEIQALIDRIAAHERTSAEAINRVQARLENVSDKLAATDHAAPAMPQKPEDVPGFSALESAMRNIVDHIESSEIATRDSLKGIQQRMSEMAAKAAEAAHEKLNGDAPAITGLEQRVNELAARLEKSRNDSSRELQAYVQGQVSQLAERIDAVRHSTDAVVGQAQAAAEQAARGEGHKLEERLKALITELQGQKQPDADVQRIYAEIESLNQRLDNVNTNAAPESDVNALRAAVEQISGQLAQDQGSASLHSLEDRLTEMGQRLEQMDASALSPQLADLEQRVQAMDAHLHAAMSNPGDPASASRFSDQMHSFSERLTATESKFDHLSIIEQAIEQLYRSVEETRALAGQSTEGGAPAAPSADLQALESGLTAVKASAEAADQRTKETLEAVHDTLEQIIDKLAELESREAVAPMMQAVPAAPVAAADLVGTADPILSAVSGEPTPEMIIESEFASALPPSDPQPAAGTAHPGDPFATNAIGGEEPEFYAHEMPAAPQQPMPDDPAAVEPGSAPQMPEFQPEPVAAAPAPAAPAAPAAASEDFIAAARRAAQNAATQRSSILGGLNSLTSRSAASASDDKQPGRFANLFSLPFRRSPDDQFAGDSPLPDEDDEETGGSKSRRLHLILAGLVLLAAVSAYAMGDAGKRLFSQVSNNGLQATISGPQTSRGELASKAPLAGGVHSAGVQDSQPSDMANRVDAVLATSDAQLPPALPQPEMTTASLAVPDVTSSRADALAPATSEAVETSGLPAVEAAFTDQAGDLSALPEALGSKALRDAAAGGDANAQFVIASRYLDGKTVERDFAEAADWYRKAADQRLAPAQYRLGTLYERGNGMAKDIAMARKWYAEAAAASNVKAMHNLAVIHANNTNNDAQFDKAAKWFQAAAEYGLKDSLYNLAVLYERGLGVEQSTKSAYFWYGIAARHGDADGKAKMATLASFLTASQKSETDARIAKWAPKKPDAKGNFVAISDPAWQVAVNAPAAPAESDTSLALLSQKELVLKAQKLLSGMGYDVGPVDGVMGSRTANAVRLFQLQTGAPVNGNVDADLVKRLAARQT